MCSASALAQTPDRIEMDVLEIHEAPAQAVRRMEEAQRTLKARRRTPAEHPGPGAYVPEALGDRGLLVPAGLEAPGVPGDFDRHDGLGSDRTGNHDRDRGEGHDKGHDKGNGKDKGPGGG